MALPSMSKIPVREEMADFARFVDALLRLQTAMERMCMLPPEAIMLKDERQAHILEYVAQRDTQMFRVVGVHCATPGECQCAGVKFRWPVRCPT